MRYDAEADGGLAEHGTAKKLATATESVAKSSVFARKHAPPGRAISNFARPIFWPPGQLLTGHARNLAASLACVATILAVVACRSQPPTDAAAPRSDASPTRGGAIAACIRTDPVSFNRFVARDSSTELVSDLINAKLVRINKQTNDVEPWLAERWTTSPDGRRYTFTLRDASFSDGHPFTADDVVFTFAAAYDEKAGTVLADSVKAGGKALDVKAVDAHTVVVTFPGPFGPGVRLLDNLPILPKHKLDATLANGTFARTWGPSTPPAELVGLGPFVLREYAPGQHLVFERNPHYWRRAPDGGALPYLDRVTIEIIRDQNAELLRLETGQIDVPYSEVTPESYAPLRRAAAEGRVSLHDLGVAYQADWFWFNLRPNAFAGDPRAGWLQRDELRQAISMAVDRKLYADTVFLGAGEPVYGPETPANKKWYWPGIPRTPYDPARAKASLARIGLTDRGDGPLRDASGRPARFTLITQKGRPRLERGAAVIRDELKKIGLGVDVVALDGNAVIQHIVSGQYESTLFAPQPTDTDPGVNPDLWFSFGSFHVWNPNQPKPATDWERQIDELMTRQIGSVDDAERKRLYDEVQRIFAEHLPIVHFVAPRWYVAVSTRLVNVKPAIYPLPVLWAADTLAVVH
jgi:peptide/nickel transport system substrate-binding protein